MSVVQSAVKEAVMLNGHIISMCGFIAVQSAVKEAVMLNTLFSTL